MVVIPRLGGAAAAIAAAAVVAAAAAAAAAALRLSRLPHCFQLLPPLEFVVGLPNPTHTRAATLRDPLGLEGLGESREPRAPQLY